MRPTYGVRRGEKKEGGKSSARLGIASSHIRTRQIAAETNKGAKTSKVGRETRTLELMNWSIARWPGRQQRQQVDFGTEIDSDRPGRSEAEQANNVKVQPTLSTQGQRGTT